MRSDDTGSNERAIDEAEARSRTTRALELALSLRGVLEEERVAIAVADPGGLTSLAARKQRLLTALEAMQPALGRALVRLPEGDPSRRELLEALEACRERNVENGTATGAALHHVRKTLGLLRETLSLDDLTLYDDHGELHVRRERRGLGRA